MGSTGDTLGTPVGRVLGTADATPLTFWVAVGPEAYLQLDDVVVTQRELPEPAGAVTISGVVTAVRARHEGAAFDSDVFAIADGMLPAQVQEAAEITVTRVEPEVYVPPMPGAVAFRAQGQARDEALSFDRMKRKLPIGTGRDGEPLFLNADFLDGSRGAHVSISGISGVATKTSFATFLLYSIFHSGALGGASETANTKALIFNVKGEDLLFLDHENNRLDQRTREAYDKLGLSAGAFKQVTIFAPARAGDPSGSADVASRLTGVDTFYWTLSQFCEQRLLPYVFADADDERQQYTMVVHSVTAHLARMAVPADGGIAIDGQRLSSYDQLVDHIVGELNDDESRGTWSGSSVGLGTINAFARRLINSKRDLGRLIRGDLPSGRAHQISTADSGQITVVDLHNLPDRAQRFVVGVTLKSEFERKEKAGTAKPLLFVVLDELNKYAPRDGSSPIKEVLLDIAERGRSLGVILIGAQQTASEVERRIVANSAIRVVGRLDPAEASRPEYGFLPPAQRQRALLAKPGTMFVAQPEIPVPLAVEFPFPAWATRPSEAGAATGTIRASLVNSANPFAVVGAARGNAIPDDEIPF
ncbi:DNA helicase HerA-like ATPase [Allocatelliglobosispora scoriae]|uniref:DNA helicase HerA-like ATPase n=1 Tax=Allocatelliglobosispora scoriae TaxID=643052 RepID=A0A841BWF0_9ACTN|nr:ATP-binding protein [Allocatelliglobosispora scoriae]MBB5872484.1 DNA helicase HerA-like ATPase [Allocatelliglobosispora scoriae]